MMGKLVKVLKAIGAFFSGVLAGVAADRPGRGGVSWATREEELGDMPPDD
jgi:hypothetical protein